LTKTASNAACLSGNNKGGKAAWGPKAAVQPSHKPYLDSDVTFFVSYIANEVGMAHSGPMLKNFVTARPESVR
jgi:hypothetical protein